VEEGEGEMTIVGVTEITGATEIVGIMVAVGEAGADWVTVLKVGAVTTCPRFLRLLITSVSKRGVSGAIARRSGWGIVDFTIV
jgi:hypothetical protein